MDRELGESSEDDAGFDQKNSWMIPLIGAAILICLVICFLLVIFLWFGYTTVAAKCIPLEDPTFDIRGVETDENGTYVKFHYKASVPVRVFTEVSGEGRTILRRRAVVVNSAKGEWNDNETIEGDFASKHCLCPGCNGTEPGICKPCVPLTPNCDARPPEFSCWATVYRPLLSPWAFRIDVERVRFSKKFATIVNWDIIISLIVFAVLALLLTIVAIVLGIPQQIFGEIFRKRTPEQQRLYQQTHKKVGPW